MSKYIDLTKILTKLPDFVFEYIEVAYDGESVNTQLGYSIDIKTFLEYLRLFKFRDLESIESFTPEMLNEVTLRDLNGFKAYLQEYETEYISVSGKKIKRIRRNNEHGINRKLSGVRGLFLYLYKNDYIDHNVTDKLDFKKVHQKMKRPLSTQDVLNLIEVLYDGERFLEGRSLANYLNRKQRDIALYTAYLGTGCRVSELINLNINDVDFESSSFIVTRKGGDQQEIFMPLQVENEMLKYVEERMADEDVKGTDPLFISRNGKRILPQTVEKNLKNYCILAGITDPEKMHPHALRRTFACSMIADGVDIKMVAELMGHKNIEVTHRYYTQYAAERRKQVMREFDIVGEAKSEASVKPGEADNEE
ncbi:MAG: tyrosine-type recombinase/integrase [Clostridiales bacterium]|nr:tyrosine-type recombinase/integrase [Clostridiales bacterium]